MEKILTIGKAESSFVTLLGFEFVTLPRFSIDDERHDFLINLLVPKSFDKLIILIDGDDGYDGLKLGLHVRLTIGLHQKRLVPIMFVSSDTLAVVLRNAGTWGRILTTKGCKLERPDIKAIHSGLGFPSLSPAEVGVFLDLIQIRPDETTGRHSLANQWGAYALNKAAGTRALSNNPVLTKAMKQIYFKYVEATNYNNEKLNRPASTLIELEKSKPDRIEAKGKKILLIDDEAEKGWSDVLRVLFRTSNPDHDFHVINRKVTSWNIYSEEEKKTILSTGFDLFLIDLRLTGSEEDAAKPESFSGTDIMLQIKKHNFGNQVIMFTASNKAWNLKALLESGADGYYIKESPEYNFTESFSEENFKNFKKEAEICLLYSFLKEIWSINKDIKTSLRANQLSKIESGDSENSFNQIITQLDIAYQLLRMRQPQNFSYFVITYVRILEILVEIFLKIDENNQTITLKNGDYLKYCYWDSSSGEYVLKPFDITSMKWNSYKSIANQAMALSCELSSLDVKQDKLYLKQLYRLVQSRNDFVHEGKEVTFNPTTLLDWAKMMKKLLTSF